jgi:hypothetical protein
LASVAIVTLGAAVGRPLFYATQTDFTPISARVVELPKRQYHLQAGEGAKKPLDQAN